MNIGSVIYKQGRYLAKDFSLLLTECFNVMVIWCYNLRIVQKPLTRQDWWLRCYFSISRWPVWKQPLFYIHQPSTSWLSDASAPSISTSWEREQLLCAEGWPMAWQQGLGFYLRNWFNTKARLGVKELQLEYCLHFLFSGIQGFSAFRNWCYFMSGRKEVTGHPAKSCFSHLLSSFKEMQPHLLAQDEMKCTDTNFYIYTHIH